MRLKCSAAYPQLEVAPRPGALATDCHPADNQLVAGPSNKYASRTTFVVRIDMNIFTPAAAITASKFAIGALTANPLHTPLE